MVIIGVLNRPFDDLFLFTPPELFEVYEAVNKRREEDLSIHWTIGQYILQGQMLPNMKKNAKLDIEKTMPNPFKKTPPQKPRITYNKGEADRLAKIWKLEI